MTRKIFRIEEGSLQHNFLQSVAKVQLFGGGFANGKTSGACIKALSIAKDYPGANILIARSTYPKLNDTIRKEFLKWCPKHWIKSFPQSQNSVNTCVLKNGTNINFRYIAQQGKGEDSTSNLLSATYDAIIVDQIEDPEIVYKDFLDLLGRLRGNTPYVGDDPRMPLSGPRWFLITCNPTRNWVYKYIVKPVHDYAAGKVNEHLLADESGKPLIEIFEGSTYTNAANLGEDFIKTLEAAYHGQMKTRFLLGEWSAYEGLVYSQFDESMHCMSRALIVQYHKLLIEQGYKVNYIEGFDHGIAKPSCYLFGFIDYAGNVFILDGFYKSELSVEAALSLIFNIRHKYAGTEADDNIIWADPAIFKRTGGAMKTVGPAISSLFYNEGNGVRMRRGNNDISGGVVKVGTYLTPAKMHRNPITGAHPAPYLYLAEELDFVINEFTNYYWKKDTAGEREDKPQDKDDHAMDTIKYMLSKRPQITQLKPVYERAAPGYTRWNESEIETNTRNLRHG